MPPSIRPPPSSIRVFTPKRVAIFSRERQVDVAGAREQVRDASGAEEREVVVRHALRQDGDDVVPRDVVRLPREPAGGIDREREGGVVAPCNEVRPWWPVVLACDLRIGAYPLREGLHDDLLGAQPLRGDDAAQADDAVADDATRWPGRTRAMTAAWWPVPITSESVSSEGMRASPSVTSIG